MSVSPRNESEWDPFQVKLGTLSGAWLAIDPTGTIKSANSAAKHWLNGGVPPNERDRILSFVQQFSGSQGGYGILPLAHSCLIGLAYTCRWCADTTLVNLSATQGVTGKTGDESHVFQRISQTLKEPVSKLELYGNLLVSGQPEKIDYYRETFLQETNRLSALVHDMHLLGRLLSPAVDRYQAVTTDQLKRAIEESLEEAGAGIIQPAKVTSSKNGSMIEGCPGLIGLAIQYLLHSIPGTDFVAEPAAIHLHSQGSWINISILNPGFSVHPEEMSIFFEPFASEKIDLELVIVRAVLKKHGGFLAAKCAEDRFFFTIWLPAHTEPEPDLQVRTASPVPVRV